MAPYPATTIANEFLRLAWAKQSTLTHMKLQKLVYIAHGWYLAISQGDPLIRERVEAWDYGPVISELYAEFAKYGKDKIDALFLAVGSVDGSLTSVEPSIEDDDSLARNVIDRIWEVYGDLNAYQLSSMTHEPDTPWEKARQRGGSVIRDEDIFDHFKQLSRATA